MAGAKDQKLKTLYIMRYLERNTDSDHGATVEEIVAYLGSLGIGAERKSIYADIELLRLFGMDIETARYGGRFEYRLVSREFQLPELKLLVDAVSSSKFITRKKSLELIKKLEQLCSVSQARQLRRNVYVDNRVKTMNESIYYNVDAIHQSINGDLKLSFKYFNYSPKKERVMRRSGDKYVVCPLALTFSDGNYYLYAYAPEHGEVRTYRVDRMTEADVSREKRGMPDSVTAFDPALHTNEMFSMYSGRRCSVTMSFDNSLATVVIDRYGPDIIMLPDGPDRFSVTADVMVSPTFLGWIFGFGKDARITSPHDVAEQLVELAEQVASLYGI